jgi:hypothetical protein
MTLHLLGRLANELMGQVEDQDGRAFNCLLDRGVGDNILGQSDTRQVFEIFVVLVDQFGELLRL